MSALVTSPEMLQRWLDALVTAAPAERRSVWIEAVDDAGVASTRVHCKLHPKAGLNFTAAFSHLDRTEASHRLQHGPDARLHQLGDLVPMAQASPRAARGRIRRCGSCRAEVIWAVTSSGSRMPLNAEPDAAGNVVLAASSEPGGGHPLAVVLHTEWERENAAPGTVHRSHFETCPQANNWRRR